MPPLLVTALSTPPSAPPYSAEMPLVFTCTSCRYSNTVFWRDCPFTSELVTMPSTVNAFSAPLAPFTWNPPSISPALTDGAVKASDWNERPLGSRSISSEATLCAINVLRRSTSGADSPVTWTTSVRAPTDSWVFNSNARPSTTLMSVRSTTVKPVSSNRTLYRPGARSGAMNCPFASVTNVLDSPEILLVVTTVTPGNAPLV